MKCHKCDCDMEIKEGKFGKFYACTGYPQCKHTISYIKSESETKKDIMFIVNKFAKDMRKELNINDNIKIEHFCRNDMISSMSACCNKDDTNKFFVKFNVQYPFSNYGTILKALSHEYKHIQQIIEGRMDNYDFNAKWRTRLEEDEAIKFSDKYINKIILKVDRM